MSLQSAYLCEVVALGVWCSYLVYSPPPHNSPGLPLPLVYQISGQVDALHRDTEAARRRVLRVEEEFNILKSESQGAFVLIPNIKYAFPTRF